MSMNPPLWYLPDSREQAGLPDSREQAGTNRDDYFHANSIWQLKYK
jgi:hypothetical protein